MSLKVFHILFVTISILLMVGFGFWCILVGFSSAIVNIATGLASFILAIILFKYGVVVWKKFQGDAFKEKE